jgi:hypothetical protein
MFAHLISGNNITAESEDGRRYQGIIPDIVIKANAIPFASDKHADNPLFNRQSLLDVKTLAPGSAYSEHTNVSAATGAVSRRQSQVTVDYHHNAHQLDRKFNATAQGAVGPVESEVNRYGVNGRVLGLVIGAFGECSTDVYYLRDLIAEGHATALTARVNITHDQALSMYTQKLNRLWGLLIARGWARVLLGRQSLIFHGGRNNGAAQDSPAMHGFIDRDADIHEIRNPLFYHYRHRGGLDGQ